jgi:hypothetical protein
LWKSNFAVGFLGRVLFDRKPIEGCAARYLLGRGGHNAEGKPRNTFSSGKFGFEALLPGFTDVPSYPSYAAGVFSSRLSLYLRDRSMGRCHWQTSIGRGQSDACCMKFGMIGEDGNNSNRG